jgi:hypothetical protein
MRRRIALGVSGHIKQAIAACADPQEAARRAFEAEGRIESRLWAERANELNWDRLLGREPGDA